jgi:hypothetical protein
MDLKIGVCGPYRLPSRPPDFEANRRVKRGGVKKKVWQLISDPTHMHSQSSPETLQFLLLGGAMGREPPEVVALVCGKPHAGR